MYKGIVSIISNDSPGKDGIARFTTIPLKALSDQVSSRYPLLYF